MANRTVSAGSSAPLKGVLCIVTGGLFLTMNDALLKWLAGDYPVGQIMFVRGLFVFIPISILVWQAGGITALRITRTRTHVLRTLLVIAGTFLFITGLRYLPLADAITITFAGPLFVTALAAPILGEVIRWRRWLAVAVGFVGVIIIVRPSGNIAQMAALLPLCASLTGAFRDILTRYMASRESSISVLFYTSLGVTVAGGATYIMGWQNMPITDIAFLALSGMLMGSAHFLMIETYRFAEAAFVAPFKYVSMIWAIILGFLVWGEYPDRWTLFGAAIVISSGIYIMHREKTTLNPTQKN